MNLCVIKKTRQVIMSSSFHWHTHGRTLINKKCTVKNLTIFPRGNMSNHQVTFGQPLAKSRSKNWVSESTGGLYLDNYMKKLTTETIITKRKLKIKKCVWKCFHHFRFKGNNALPIFWSQPHASDWTLRRMQLQWTNERGKEARTSTSCSQVSYNNGGSDAKHNSGRIA